MNASFRFEESTITLSSLTVGGRNRKTIIADTLLRALQSAGAENTDLLYFNVLTFAEFVASVAQIEGAFPVSIPRDGAPIEAWLLAYDAFQDLPEGFLDLYSAAKLVTQNKGAGEKKT